MKPVVSSPTLRVILKFLAAIGNFFDSRYSQFGLRAACASLAGTLPAFFHSSYVFFIQYRGVWITFTVLIGMSPTTGASIYGLLKRCSGTILGGLLAMAVWYIVDQRIPGIIVLSFVVAAYRILSFFKADIRLLPRDTRLPKGMIWEDIN